VPIDAPTVPSPAELRRTTDGIAASAHLIGQLMLEVAPAHLTDAAADILAPLCEAIGEDLEHRSRRPLLRDLRGPPSPIRHRPVTAGC
jgi:hypothetical protein